MPDRRVPFFDYPRVFTDDEERTMEIVRDVGRRGAFIMQKDLFDFERDLADYLGCAETLGVANATDGMEVGLRAVGLQPGDEVICCSHTMLATAAAIHFAGGVPVPVDIGADNLIDTAAVEAAVGPRTVGIMPTQLNGRVCDMDGLQAVVEKAGLFLAEDAAQALGATFKGRCAGTFGVAAAISFYPAKVLGCLGDAGAAMSNDPAVFERMYQIRDHGRDREGEVRCWGRNSRLDNLQAAILRHRLKDYPAIIERRRQVAAHYQQRLGDLGAVRLPPAPDADADHFDVYQNYEMRVERRDDLKRHLAEAGVGTLVQWGGQAVHQFSALGFDVSLPETERFFAECLMLPMNVFISDDDVEYVCEQVIAFYQGT